MIEKALIIVIFMYAGGVGFLTAQYVADSIGFTMTSISGVPIKSNVLALMDVDNLNVITLNVTETNATTIRTDPITAAAEIAFELFQLITGTYIFNMLLLFDVPVVLVGGMLLIYLILMIRAIVAYLRGI